MVYPDSDSESEMENARLVGLGPLRACKHSKNVHLNTVRLAFGAFSVHKLADGFTIY